MNREKINAQIEGTVLGYEDHGILTCFLHLRWPASGQGFGGYAMDKWVGERGHGRRQGVAYGMEFIAKILWVVGVSKWESLKGQHVRMDHDHGEVYGIGHITEDRWFYPKIDQDLKAALDG